ncbi:MAG: hypothetical protein WDN10_02790 [bacterium]
MNDPCFLAIVAWRTANRQRQIRAEKLSKDYGLSALQQTLYVGRLSFKERREFEMKMRSLFTGKRDRLHLFSSCKSCALNSTADAVIGEYYKIKSFEIV